MKVIAALCLTVGLSMALSACGQKGPLVLPSPQFPPPAAGGQPDPVPAKP